MHRSAPEGHRVLVVTPYGRDAENVRSLLSARGYDALVCSGIDDAARRLDDHVGAVLVAEEALSGNLAALRSAIERQPPWSALPFILLLAPHTPRQESAASPRLRLLEFINGLVVLERPIGSVSLISTIDAALRSRQRQFELRDRLNELARSHEALAKSEAELRQAAETLETKVAERTRALHAEIANRLQAEAALRQSQKMEAVGQLTGGIAHDFNNMLTGIMGCIDVIQRRIASGRVEGLERFMDAALASAQRAGTLTQRLLAFSRRQPLDPRAMDVNKLVTSLEELLRRTLTERITLRLALSEQLPSAVADENQLENALLNLAINARDAMPDGGRLTIATSMKFEHGDATAELDIAPGRYVVIEVCDTGVGMPPAVLEKVFDPFFTTKPLGQGTGLGLSMVYGFAKQSGGQVRIHSTVGEGTSVRLYLPATDASALEVSAQASSTPTGQGETVLLIEDDSSVRILVREALTELGYEALEADEPFGALPLLRSGRRIDLLISDVGLPGMSGRELAEIARQHRPELPILFITGYAENATIRAEFLGANMAMITKPFALDALARKIGELLEAQNLAMT